MAAEEFVYVPEQESYTPEVSESDVTDIRAVVASSQEIDRAAGHVGLIDFFDFEVTPTSRAHSLAEASRLARESLRVGSFPHEDTTSPPQITSS